jgi:hypothetical protein
MIIMYCSAFVCRMFDPVGIICYMLLHVNQDAAYGLEFAPHCMFLDACAKMRSRTNDGRAKIHSDTLLVCVGVTGSQDYCILSLLVKTDCSHHFYYHEPCC